jgi:hypothetical protein
MDGERHRYKETPKSLQDEKNMGGNQSFVYYYFLPNLLEKMWHGVNHTDIAMAGSLNFKKLR